MISTTNPIPAPSPGESPADRERRERAAREDRKAERTGFLAGLEREGTPAERADAARSAAPRARAADSGPKTPEAVRRDEDEGDVAPEYGSGAAEAAEETGGGLLDFLARRAVRKTARQALAERVVRYTPKLAESPARDLAAPLPRELTNEKRVENEKKSVVEEAHRDPEVAVRAGFVPPEAQASAAPAPLPKGHPVPPPVFRQMVAFAEVHRDRTGVIEFKLGLRGAVLGGAEIVLRSFGERKIGLRVRNGADRAITEKDLEELVAALRGRRLDVVEVELA